MFQGVTALLERSLRTEARAGWTHIFRLVFLLCSYGCFVQVQWDSAWRGAPGLQFFQSVAYLDAILIVIAGSSFFARAITEEKEEGTLGLMLLAGISPLGLLLGKSVGRLTQVLFLLAVQFPLMQLSVTLGGILPHQLTTVYAELFAFTILLSGAGLFFSVLARSSGRAARATLVFVAAYLLLPLIASWLVEFLDNHYSQTGVFVDTLRVLPSWCIFYDLSQILTTGFGGNALRPQVITNCLGGLLGYLAAWICFPLSQRETSQRSRRWFFNRSTRLVSPGRCWSWPFLWKEFYFAFGSWTGLIRRVVLFGLGTVGLLGVQALNSPWMAWSEVVGIMGFLLLLIVPLETAFCVARTVRTEIYQQTLSTLLMVPTNFHLILLQKIAGVLVGPLITTLLGLALVGSADEGVQFLEDALQEPVVYLYMANVASAVALSAVLATYLRWGSVIFAFGLQIASFVFGIFLLENILHANHSDSEMVIVLVWIPALLGVVALSWVIVFRRLQMLAADF